MGRMYVSDGYYAILKYRDACLQVAISGKSINLSLKVARAA